MKKEARTPAELQMEALRQLKQTQNRRKPLAAPKAIATAEPQARLATAFELTERTVSTAPKRKAPSLSLSPALWRALRERQSEHQEFKSRREMGDWAAELVLALPPHSHKLNPAAKEELRRKMREWAGARGLR